MNRGSRIIGDVIPNPLDCGWIAEVVSLRNADDLNVGELFGNVSERTILTSANLDQFAPTR